MSRFNLERWNLGRSIEDKILPDLNTFFDANLERSDDVFDIFDFKDEEKKILVEVKGRTCPSSQYPETIITCGKVTEGLMMMETGWKVYYFFVFTDETKYIKLDKDDCDFNMKLTGTNHIPHYLIPVNRLTEFNVDN